MAGDRIQPLHRHFSATADFGRPDAEVKPSRGGNGVHVKFPNGWTVSVQWGPGTYSTNHHPMQFEYPPPEMDADVAEIAAWKGDGEMVRWWDGDTVQGWQSWGAVQAVLNLAARDALPATTEVGS